MSERPIDPHKHHHAHSLPFGAHLTGAKCDNPRTRFRFWAPSRDTLQVEIQRKGNDTPELVDMQAAGDGWFEAEVDGGAGTLYRYCIDKDLAVPDPASRFQPQDGRARPERSDRSARL